MLDVNPFYKIVAPLQNFWIKAPCHVTMAENSKAILYCGDETIATAKFEISNETFYDEKYANINVIFDSPLILPKGKSYKVVIPERVFRKLDNSSCFNKKLEIDFDVPGNLGAGIPSIKDNSVLSSAYNIHFTFYYPIGDLFKPSIVDALLFREGILVRKLPTSLSSDWNLGTATVYFSEIFSFESVNFEDGVHYSVVIPAGTISATERNDIVNEETRVSFIGGYKEPMPKLECTWISAFAEGLGENIGEVRFRFNMPVALSGDPKVQICLARPGYPAVTETTPFLRDEDGRQTLVADFGGYPQSSIGEAFTFVIKEGSVVSADGDVVVNDRTESPSFSGIDAVTADSSDAVTVKAVAGTVIVEGARDGATVRLYSADGRMLCEAEVSDGFATIAVRNGIYIVSVDGIARKVAVK